MSSSLALPKSVFYQGLEDSFNISSTTSSSSTSPNCTSESCSEEIAVYAILFLVLILTIYIDRHYKHYQNQCDKQLENTDITAVKTRSINSLPGPTPFPWKLVGNLFQIPTPENFFEKCFEWCSKYGDCFKLKLFGQDFVVISSATLAQDILQSNELGHLTKTDVYHFLQGIDGLAFASGKWWRTMRKIASQAFRYQRNEKQMQIFNKHGDKFVETLEEYYVKGKTNKVSIDLEVANCAVQIIIETFISQPGACSYEESLEYVKCWHRFTEITTYRILHPWLGLNFLWKRNHYYVELNEVIEKVEEFSDTLINRFTQDQQKNHGELEDDRNLISEMLKLNYSMKEIGSEVVAMLFAHETNYLGMYYLLYMLAAHPEHQVKCRKEIDELFNSRDEFNFSNDISCEDLSQLKYLERCLLEAMRLLPPVFIFGRKLEAPLTLSNGANLPSETNCLILPLVIHKMKEYWHGDASVFDPDRFLPENSSKRNAYAYLPFSAGPRICLGMKSSIFNIKVVAAKILRRFEISSEIRFEDIKFRLNLTLAMEQDLGLKFTPRTIFNN